MHGCRINVLRKVFVASMGTLAAHSSPALLSELAECSAFDIAEVTDGDNHWIIWVEILGIELFA